jgi:hypothetical protein
MAFSILDYIDQLEPSNEPGKYQCPACGGNDFTVNKTNGAFNCWHDTSPAHRAEIRDALAPLTRWEKPPREAGSYSFVYKNNSGKDVVIVHRDDTSGSKKIWQDFPTIDKNEKGHKTQLKEVKANVLPYRYHDAIAKSEETGLPIFVVEGELTCESVWALELPCITFLGGSKQYRTNGDYSTLFRNRKLVLCPDRDEQGVAFMAEIANDNPGASWLYADPRSWEWDNLPSGNGYDLGDYIEEGASKDDLLSSIVSKSRHQGQDGKPAYEEIISTIENFVGLYANDSRIAYETGNWLEQRGVKMSQSNVEKIIAEAKDRIYGREEIETIDALTIANADKARDWLIAGIMPLGSVTLLAAAGGSGKAQCLTSKILTPFGWTEMGSIEEGDEVIAGDGTPTKVIGVFPQGVKPMYRVTMTDGSSTLCCDEHLWLTQNTNERTKDSTKWKVRPLKEIKKNVKTGKRQQNYYTIPMIEPVQFPERSFYINPYLLGVLLGDGGMTHGAVTISIGDDEIRETVLNLLPLGHCLNISQAHETWTDYRVVGDGRVNKIKDELMRLEMMGCRAWEKFVPHQYKIAAPGQRLALLQGLMDTDGYANNGSCLFSSTSEQLALDVIFLVQSLGGRATMGEVDSYYIKNGERKSCRPLWRVYFSMPKGVNAFGLSRKRDQQQYTRTYYPTRKIEKVEYVGEREAQCIMVAHPSHTYVTDDFIVTHNTTLTYNWGLHIATGTKWSGRRCMKGKCLYISSDEPLIDTSEKLSVIGYQDSGLQPGDISFWETWRFAHMKQLEDFVRKERPIFIAIDSLTACLAGMDVDMVKSNAGDVIYGLRDLANTYRCSILILHHLNKSGGLRDSTSFVDNVSEVVKLTRSESFDPSEFTLEWLKSRSGLTGKHVLKRDSLTYGWHYAGPLGGSLEELNQVVNVVEMRKTERFTRQQVAALSGSFDTGSTGKMLEVARRQGLITSSFSTGPNGERDRLYHSWDYVEPDLDFQQEQIFTEPEKQLDDENLVQKQAPQEEPVSMAKENLPVREEDHDFF